LLLPFAPFAGFCGFPDGSQKEAKAAKLESKGDGDGGQKSEVRGQKSEVGSGGRVKEGEEGFGCEGGLAIY
jgi:hypothetical protein